jgi:hypothetical protein
MVTNLKLEPGLQRKNNEFQRSNMHEDTEPL